MDNRLLPLTTIGAGGLFYLGTKQKNTFLITLSLLVFFSPCIFMTLFAVGWTVSQGEKNPNEVFNRRLSLTSSFFITLSALIAFFYTRKLK